MPPSTRKTETLESLYDVVTAAKADGDYLAWDEPTSRWKNVARQTLWPTRATLWPDEKIVIAGGAAATNIYATQKYGLWAGQSPFANGDSWTLAFALRAGAYTMSVLGLKDSNCPKVDWAVDGLAVVAGQDWYVGGGQQVNVTQTASVTVATDGVHQLRATVNGKHASSTDYFLALTKIWFAPAAD